MRFLFAALLFAITSSSGAFAAKPAKPAPDYHEMYRGAQMRLRQDVTPKTKVRAMGRMVHAAGKLAPTLDARGARATLATLQELAPNHKHFARVSALLEAQIKP